jgi:hypothetical protein
MHTSRKIKNILGVRTKAAVALTTLIVVSSMLLLSGVTLMMINIDLAHSNKSVNSNMINRINADSCLEEGLLRLSNDPSYTGTFSLTFEDGNCNGTISNDTIPNTKIILIDSDFDGYTYHKEEKVNMSTNPISLVQ